MADPHGARMADPSIAEHRQQGARSAEQRPQHHDAHLASGSRAALIIYFQIYAHISNFLSNLASRLPEAVGGTHSMSMPLGSSGLGSDGLPISGGGTGAQLFAQKQQDMSETAEQTAAEAKAAAERTAAEQAAAEQAAAEQAQRATAERAAALRSTAYGTGGLLRSTMRALSLFDRTDAPAYAKLVDEEGDDGFPGTNGSKLLNFCAGKGLVSLSELENVLRTAPTSATDRVVPMSEEESSHASPLMVEGESAISILIRRCASTEEAHAMNKDELPAMIQALVSADKTAVLALSTPAQFGWSVTSIGATHADLKRTEGDAHMIDVPLHWLRPTGSTLRRGDKVLVSKPIDASTALHMLCNDDVWSNSSVSVELLERTLEILLGAIRELGGVALFDGVPPDSGTPPRYDDMPEPPLLLLCSSQRVTLYALKELLHSFPRAVMASSKGGNALTILLTNPEARLPMIELLAKESGGFRRPPRGRTGTQYYVARVHGDGQTVDLESVPTSWQPKQTLQDVPVSRLRPLYSPTSHPAPSAPKKGDSVELLATSQPTYVSLAAERISNMLPDMTDQIAVETAAKRATRIYSKLVEVLSPEELGARDEDADDKEGTPAVCSVLFTLARLPAPVLEAVLAVVPKAVVHMWVSASVRADGFTVMHAAASFTTLGRPSMPLIRAVHALIPSGISSIGGENRCTPLHLLCRATELQVEDLDTLLLKHTPSASTADNHGRVPLYDLLENERQHELQGKLVARYLEVAPDAAGHADVNGRTPLHLLCSTTELQVEDLDALLSKHIPAATMADENGRVPLHNLLLQAQRLRELQGKLVARYLEVAPDAAGYADADRRTPLHLLCSTAELQVVDLDALLLKHIPAATMADENGRVPLHYLLDLPKSWRGEQLDEAKRPRELQNKLVARYLEFAPDAAGHADAQGKLPAESLFTLPNLSARHFVCFIELAPNPLLPCLSIAAALVKAAARDANRRSVYLRVAEELTVVSTSIVRGLPSLKEDGWEDPARPEAKIQYPYADDWKNSVPLLLPAELLPPIASLQVRHTTASGTTNLS